MAKKSNSTVLSSPDLPPQAELAGFSGQRLSATEPYRGLLFAALDLSGSPTPGLSLTEVLFIKTVARNVGWRDLRLRDVRFSACDLANVDWLGTQAYRLEICDSRLTGANLSESKLTDVRFVGCKMDAAAFLHTAFIRVRFENCDLRGANFEAADLTGVVFSHCNLNAVRLAGARMKQTDFRSSDLQNIDAAAADFRGAIIAPAQAIEVVTLAGVTVQSPTEVGT